MHFLLEFVVNSIIYKCSKLGKTKYHIKEKLQTKMNLGGMRNRQEKKGGGGGTKISALKVQEIHPKRRRKRGWGGGGGCGKRKKKKLYI